MGTGVCGEARAGWESAMGGGAGTGVGGEAGRRSGVGAARSCKDSGQGGAGRAQCQGRDTSREEPVEGGGPRRKRWR